MHKENVISKAWDLDVLLKYPYLKVWSTAKLQKSLRQFLKAMAPQTEAALVTSKTVSLTDTTFDIYARTGGVTLCYLSTSKARNRNVWDPLTCGCELKDEYNVVRLHKETPMIVRDKTIYLQLDRFALGGSCLSRNLK